MEELMNIQSKLNVPIKGTGRDVPIPHSPGVYVIVNPKKEIYVGSTKDLNKRFGQYSGKSFKGQRKLHNSFVFYGKSRHNFMVVEYCEIRVLLERERYWSDRLNAIHGLNLIVTGYGNVKAETSIETRKRQGDAQRGKKYHRNIVLHL